MSLHWRRIYGKSAAVALGAVAGSSLLLGASQVARPPYFHDGRLLTLEDTVEFFDLVLELKLTPEEKHNLVEFMRRL